MLILAFDTATEMAACALVDGVEVLAERRTVAKALLQDVDAMLRQTGVRLADLEALAVGTGPGSFTSTRIGLAIARGLGLGLGLPAAGVSTLDALAAGAGAGDAVPVIDAKRGEVFVPGPRALRPDALELAPGTTCVGDGARRYRDALTALGASVPPDDSDLHVPRARFHAALAASFGSPDALEPVYVRAPDADRVLA